MNDTVKMFRVINPQGIVRSLETDVVEITPDAHNVDIIESGVTALIYILSVSPKREMYTLTYMKAIIDITTSITVLALICILGF